MRAIYFIRHGKTYYNLMHRIQGWSDTPLTKRGRKQSLNFGRKCRKLNLKIPVIFSSDMGRSVSTAKYIAMGMRKDIDIKINQCLREQFFGSFEGLNQIKVAKQLSLGLDGHLIRKHGWSYVQNKIAQSDSMHLAEDDNQFWQRFAKGIMEIVKDEPNGQPIFIIGHSMVLTDLMSKYAPKMMNEIVPDNLSLTKITVPNNRFQPKVVYYNKKL